MSKKIKRRIRHVYSASAAHGYRVKNYIQYEDGEIVFQNDAAIPIAKTGVRLRNIGSWTWEERLPGCPGWFRCEDPTQ